MRAVAVRVMGADFAKQMVSMRDWLDRHRRQPTRFVYNQAEGEVVASVECPDDGDAEAFAIRFEGESRVRSSKTLTPNGHRSPLLRRA